MPKLKTNRGAAKRFRVAANGRFKHKRSNRNHILTKRSRNQKRRLKSTALVSKSDHSLVVRLLNRIFKK